MRTITNTTIIRGAIAAGMGGILLLTGLIFHINPFSSVYAETATSTPITISSIVATTTSDGTGATITWLTDEPANAQIMYGLTTTYATSSNLDIIQSTSHLVNLSGLSPNTTYHFQVLSTNASGTVATSSDQMFFTTLATSTGTTTDPTATTTASTSPVISGISTINSTTGTSTTIMWTTDQPATSRVAYGSSSGNYSTSTLVDTTLVTNHSVMLENLTPTMLYHFMITSANEDALTSTSTDLMFTTAMGSTSTSTTTDSDITSLKSRVLVLEQKVATLEQQIQALLHNNNGTGTNPGNNNGQSGSAMIDPVSPVQAGTSINLGGRNFGHEESVTVMSDGQLITTAHADGGGNFTTGSLSVPSTPGNKTYTLTGVNSGISRSVTVSIY